MPHFLTRRPIAISRRWLAPVVATAALLPSLTYAGPAWEALPDDTVFALRMPNTRAFIDEFKNNTVAGQRIFTAERFDKLKQLLQNQDPDDWQEFNEAIESYGFTLTDLMELAQSNWGMGFVTTPRGEDELPRMLLLGWAEMDEEKIDRIFAALDQTDQNPEAAEALRRADYELAGVPVRQYSIAQEGMDRETDWSTPDGFYELTEAQQDDHWKKVEEESNKAQYTKIDETHMLFARRPGQIVMGLGLPQSQETVRGMIAEGQEISWDQATDIESVKSTLEAFLSSVEQEKTNGFAQRMMDQPDAAATVGKENTLFEFYGDLSKSLSLIGDGIRLESDAEAAEMYQKSLASLGLDKLGVIAGTGYFSDQSIRYQMFAQAGERSALPATLDGQTLPAGPPAWVPAGVSYFHLAYDLSKLYDVVMQSIADLAGPEAAQQSQMANNLVQMYAGADIPTILKALGTRHSVMLLEAQPMKMTSREWDFEAEEMKEVENEIFMRPGAIVWELADAPVLQQVMAAIKGFAGAAEEQGVGVVDEQNFTGVRMSQEPFPASFMVGEKHMMFGFGPDISGRTLTLLNTPPAQDNRLATSSLSEEAAQLIDYREGIAFFINDSGEDIIGSKRMMSHAIGTDSNDEDTEMMQQLLELLPSDEDLRASFGVSVGQMYMTEGGLVYEGAAATPAAE